MFHKLLLFGMAAILAVFCMYWLQLNREETLDVGGSTVECGHGSDDLIQDPMPSEKAVGHGLVPTDASHPLVRDQSTEVLEANGKKTASESPTAKVRSSIGRIYPVSAEEGAAVDAAHRQMESVQDVLSDPAIDWSNPKQSEDAVKRIQAAENRNVAKAAAIARQLGLPLRKKMQDGGLRELVGIDDDTGELLYFETTNNKAAISVGADLVHVSPYNLDGAGQRVGVWDGGSALTSHQEFNDGAASRVNNMDGSSPDGHATHVAGTIGAYGVVPRAKGMANQVTIDSYNWGQDVSEMTAAGATAPGQYDSKIYLSNQSYGYAYGWELRSGVWTFLGTGSDQNAYEPKFGQYRTRSRTMDLMAHNAPYYLMFWSAGNENQEGPNNGNTVKIGGAEGIIYDNSIHPAKDGLYRGGFETIGDMGVAKNVITVGSVTDAVTNGLRDPSVANISGFSCTGPVDDGRIKPDLVANGASLYSPVSNSNTSYGTKTGTSMSSPNATGAAALLIDQYRDLFGSQAAMRACTLKGLLIHTATDLGNPGPDYTHGWGLIDVKTAADLLKKQADHPSLDCVVEDQLTTADPIDSYSFTWDGVSPICATLSWTDPADEVNNAHDDRTPDLVNDLNLKLIAPDGSQHYPFVMHFVGTWTIASMREPATTGINNVDNTEQVLVQSPGQPGTWRVEVTYTGNLTNGYQHYGLLISGSAPNTPPAAYTAWTQGTFANPFTITDPNSDPDGDGMLNFMEFAFDMDPTESDRGSLSYEPDGDVTRGGPPILINQAAQGENPQFHAVFVRRKDHAAAGLVYNVDFSADLGQWSTSFAIPAVLTDVGSSGEMEAVSVPYPASVASEEGFAVPRFFRVGVDMVTP